MNNPNFFWIPDQKYLSLKFKLLASLPLSPLQVWCIGYGNFGSTKIVDTVDFVRIKTYPVLIQSATLRQCVIDSNNAILLAIDGDEFFADDLLEAQEKFNRVVDEMIANSNDKFLVHIKEHYNTYVESGVIEGLRMVRDTSQDPTSIQKVANQSKNITREITNYALAKENEFTKALDSIVSFAIDFRKIFSMTGATLIAMVVLLSVIISIVVKSIRKLTYNATLLAKGNLEQPILVDRKDEIGQLQSNFETMRVTLSDQIQNLDSKVDERTKELQMAKREIQDILDAISQGIFTFNFDMTINPGHSKEAKLLFNRENFEGCRLEDVLGLDEGQSLEFQKWLRIIKGMKRLRQFRKNARLVPLEEYSVEYEGVEKIIRLEYRPVVEAGQVSKIMVLGKEVTEERKTERALAEASRHQEANMNRVMSLINNDYQDVQIFIESLYEIVMKYQVEIEGALKDHIHEYFREIHTAKGTSGTLGFTRLTELLSEVEDLLEVFRKGSI